MSKVINRQLVNVALSASVLNPITVGVTLRFAPNYVVVRQIAYSTDEDPEGYAYQIYTDLIPDQILGVFPDVSSTVAPNSTFLLNSGGPMRTFQLMIQDAPIGTFANPGPGIGSGPVTEHSTGTVALLLEFQQCID